MAEKLNRIKEVLVREGVSQKSLAKTMNKTEYTVSNWCINKSQPHLKELFKIAEILEIEVCELLAKKRNWKIFF